MNIHEHEAEKEEGRLKQQEIAQPSQESPQQDPGSGIRCQKGAEALCTVVWSDRYSGNRPDCRLAVLACRRDLNEGDRPGCLTAESARRL